MKRMAGVLAGAFLLVVSLAGSALAQTYPTSPSPTTVVEGTGGGPGGAGGTTAFTGSNVSTALVLLGALVVLGAVALFVARRRSAHETS